MQLQSTYSVGCTPKLSKASRIFPIIGCPKSDVSASRSICYHMEKAYYRVFGLTELDWSVLPFTLEIDAGELLTLIIKTLHLLEISMYEGRK